MRNATYSVSDPALLGLFSPGGYVDLAGVSVSEHAALGLTAFYRAVSLITGTLASMPLRSLRQKTDDEVEEVTSVFDNPDGDDGQTSYEWKETAFLHLLLHGNVYGLKVRNDAGGLVALPLVHPMFVAIEEPTLEEYASGELPLGRKWFRVTLANGRQYRWDAEHVWHVPGLSVDGIRGISLLSYARLSLATAISGDKAAYKKFDQGALISGFVSPDGTGADAELDEGEAKEVKRVITNTFTGVENAGMIPVLSRKLKFNPWTMSAADAQFIQSRQFQIEEISRLTGVPPHLLMQTEKQTSWGTGVEEQNRALGRTVLGPWATRFEERGSRLLAKPRFVKFDFAGLERPSPDKETDLLIARVNNGLMTLNEARKVLGLPRVEGGDQIKSLQGSQGSEQAAITDGSEKANAA